MPLKIKSKDQCELDHLALGETMIRLSPPGRQRIEFAPYFEAWVGGGEYNAAYAANLNEIKINLPTKTQNEDCPWGAGNYEVEQQFFLGLNSATQYRIIGNVLQIPYGEAESMQALNFQATQPPVEEVLDLTPLNGTFWYLAALGDTEGLNDLLRVVPQRHDEEPIAQARIEGLLLDGESARACQQIRGQIASRPASEPSAAVPARTRSSQPSLSKSISAAA